MESRDVRTIHDYTYSPATKREHIELGDDALANLSMVRDALRKHGFNLSDSAIDKIVYDTPSLGVQDVRLYGRESRCVPVLLMSLRWQWLDQ